MARKIILSEPVYTYHIDFSRHVSNIVYIQWMENARLRLLETVGLPILDTDREGYLPVLAETSIRYRVPVYLGETVEVHLWLSRLTRLFAVMQFHFYKPGQTLAATASQKGVFVDQATGRPMRLEAEQVELFLPYLEEST